jgi:hypothetical protein
VYAMYDATTPGRVQARESMRVCASQSLSQSASLRIRRVLIGCGECVVDGNGLDRVG